MTHQEKAPSYQRHHGNSNDWPAYSHILTCVTSLCEDTKNTNFTRATQRLWRHWNPGLKLIIKGQLCLCLYGKQTMNCLCAMGGMRLLRWLGPLLQLINKRYGTPERQLENQNYADNKTFQDSNARLFLLHVNTNHKAMVTRNNAQLWLTILNMSLDQQRSNT